MKAMKAADNLSSHPSHPATVHWPLALLTTAYGLDVLYPILPILPTTLLSYLPAGPEVARCSYYALSAGLLASLPAVVTGIANAAQSFKAQGMYEADGKTLKKKTKVIIAHAVSNDLVIAVSAYIWWSKRQATTLTYAPETWMVLLSALLGVGILFAANLGGSLIYNYGMGVSIGKGKGKSS